MQKTKNKTRIENINLPEIQLQETNMVEELSVQQQLLQKSIDYHLGFQQQLAQYEDMLIMEINDQIGKFQTIKSQLIDQQRQIQEIAKELMKYEGTYEQILATSTNQIQKFQRESQALWAQLQQLNSQNNELEAQLIEFQKKSKDIQNQQRILNEQYQKLTYQEKIKQKELQSICKNIEITGKKMEETFMLKKKLNNQLQEQRGNIRVYCRIRPFHEEEEKQNFIEINNDTTLKLKVPKQAQKSVNHQKDYVFNFEQIFGQNQRQVSIFNELAQLIQSSVDGNTVTIFAYGQTGSGKTFTMQGGQQNQQRGIIPRSIELIFDEINRAKSFSWDYKVLVTIQQIYLETVRDLLSEDGQFTEFQIKSPKDIEILFEKAMTVRKVAETQCNQRSSRSHLIFTLKLQAENVKTAKTRKGCLNLIDLAGSQRVTVSKVQGDRLKQTQSINKSLTHLGDVISSLANKQQHIPYRNSKLTYILQNSLASNCKTLMFVNVSPNSTDFNQTLCSLRFAEKVKECKIKKDTFK